MTAARPADTSQQPSEFPTHTSRPGRPSASPTATGIANGDRHRQRRPASPTATGINDLARALSTGCLCAISLRTSGINFVPCPTIASSFTYDGRHGVSATRTRLPETTCRWQISATYQATMAGRHGSRAVFHSRPLFYGSGMRLGQWPVPVYSFTVRLSKRHVLGNRRHAPENRLRSY